MPDILYAINPDAPALDEALALYRASTLAERRPVGDTERFARMLAGSNLIVTARLGDAGRLVGMARSVTDHAYCTYLSDLCVDQAFQRQGIGRRLVERTREAAPLASVILLAAPAAVDYYPAIGMAKHPAAFTLPPITPTA